MRAVVAMSGGVDSSVAASMAIEAGYDVIGVALRLWDYGSVGEEKFGTCCSPDDMYDARRVASQLGIPFYVVRAEDDFREQVVNDFVRGYGSGITPSPCVHCNHKVKFRRLLTIARELGGEKLLTGHYAQNIVQPDGQHALFRGQDAAKDQSYFLFNLTQEDLAMVEFPLGNLTKEQVRHYASDHAIPTASKHESQELCFVPDNDYARFLAEEGVAGSPGPIVDLAGRTLGEHAGLQRYTVGQRKGIGIASSLPLYVIERDMKTNTLIVGNNASLLRDGLIASRTHWIGRAPTSHQRVSARIRYRASAVPVTILPLDSEHLTVWFESPQRAVAPGQAVVFYDGDRVLGGGWIEREIHRDPHTAQEMTV